MRKSLLLFAAMFVAMFVTGCSQNTDNSDAVYDNAAPTDLSDVIKIYEKYKGKNISDVPIEELMQYNENSELIILSDTSYAIDLKKYADSENKYLANAEWMFNACAFTFNIWSNHEMYLRGLDGGNIISSTVSMDSRCINNDTIRKDAEEYKEHILNLLENNESGNPDIIDESYEYLSEMKVSIEGSLYKITDDLEALLDSIDTVFIDMEKRTENTFKKYIDTPEDERLIMMLNAMNNCKTFDDQCSLLMNWANCKESESEDVWIIGVSERLLNSGKYNPCLEHLWIMWRSLKQSYCYGLSRDSTIPNDEFNEMRKKCFITVLDRVERHPDDKLAMAYGTNIAGRFNMNRYGMFYFGNEASIEMAETMPNRYKDIFDDDNEEEETEESSEN